MTDIKVPRELLERVISKMNIVWQKTDEIEEIKALLAQPAAPTDGEVYRRKSSGDALLAAQAKCDAPADARCEHCDGTGDVHRADGEWLGSCVCPAGKAPADGEAVEVVCEKSHGAWDGLDDLANLPDGAQLMTVAQHRSILALRDAKMAGVVEALELLYSKLKPNVNGADETYFFIGLRDQVTDRQMERISEAIAAYRAQQEEK